MAGCRPQGGEASDMMSVPVRVHGRILPNHLPADYYHNLTTLLNPSELLRVALEPGRLGLREGTQEGAWR